MVTTLFSGHKSKELKLKMLNSLNHITVAPKFGYKKAGGMRGNYYSSSNSSYYSSSTSGSKPSNTPKANEKPKAEERPAPKPEKMVRMAKRGFFVRYKDVTFVPESQVAAFRKAGYGKI